MAHPAPSHPAPEPDPHAPRPPRRPQPRPLSHSPDTDPAVNPVFTRLDLNYQRPYPRSEYRRRLLWIIARALLFRWPLPRWNRVRLALLRAFGARVHPTAQVRPTASVFHPWLLTMGPYATLGDRVNVYNLGPIRIGAHTTISQNAHLCAGTHDWKRPDMPLIRSSIDIGAGVWVCADAFIGPDTRLGNNSIVSARAVVMRDVPPSVIVAGNPAHVIGPRQTLPPEGWTPQIHQQKSAPAP